MRGVDNTEEDARSISVGAPLSLLAWVSVKEQGTVGLQRGKNCHACIQEKKPAKDQKGITMAPHQGGEDMSESFASAPMC